MKRALRLLAILSVLCNAACIENDIPYPVVELSVRSISGEGFSVKEIDLSKRTVTLSLDEQTDIRAVRFTEVTYTEGATPSIDLTSGSFDLRTPIYITLSLYQDYPWTIQAEQTIDRRFSVEGQIGASVFDTKNRIVTASVTENTDLESLAVHELRLEPEVYEEGINTTTYSPSLEELSGSSFLSVRFVDVTCHGRTERWTLQVTPTHQTVTLTRADAWTRVIWLYGEGISGETMGFRYRPQGADDAAWTEVPGVSVSGGSFTARLKVEPESTYEIKAYCGDEETPAESVTTEAEQQLPNSDLESWSQPKAPWLPYASGPDGTAIGPFWGSGNNGATVLGDRYNLTTPVTDLHPGASGNYSAQLESRYVVVKLAAGNLFTGEFAGIRNLSHGIVNFGRPFTLRPTALRLWVKYTRGNITNIGTVPAGKTIQIGDPDEGSIFVALGTWTKEEYGYGKDKEELFGTDDCPVSIDTRDVGTFFNPNSKDVIGYGERFFTESVGEWTRITIPIEYVTTDKRPTHIIVVCSASRWGDYFTGSSQSKMWVDDFELLYD